jgi:hypothetical protein
LVARPRPRLRLHPDAPDVLAEGHGTLDPQRQLDAPDGEAGSLDVLPLRFDMPPAERVPAVDGACYSACAGGRELTMASPLWDQQPGGNNYLQQPAIAHRATRREGVTFRCVPLPRWSHSA